MHKIRISVMISSAVNGFRGEIVFNNLGFLILSLVGNCGLYKHIEHVSFQTIGCSK